MRRAAAAAARASLRAWWPELACAALLVLIGMAGQKDDPLFAAFVAIIGGMFWAMGYRHRHLSLHGKIDRLTEDFTGLARDLREQDSEPQRPHLQVVHTDKDAG